MSTVQGFALPYFFFVLLLLPVIIIILLAVIEPGSDPVATSCCGILQDMNSVMGAGIVQSV